MILVWNRTMGNQFTELVGLTLNKNNVSTEVSRESWFDGKITITQLPTYTPRTSSPIYMLLRQTSNVLTGSYFTGLADGINFFVKYALTEPAGKDQYGFEQRRGKNVNDYDAVTITTEFVDKLNTLKQSKESAIRDFKYINGEISTKLKPKINAWRKITYGEIPGLFRVDANDYKTEADRIAKSADAALMSLKLLATRNIVPIDLIKEMEDVVAWFKGHVNNVVSTLDKVVKVIDKNERYKYNV